MRRLLSDDRLDELGALREGGASLGKLALLARQRWGISIHPNTLSWQMLRIGADLPPERRRPTPRIGSPIAKRGNHIVRRYTPEEDRRLLELEAEGLGDTAIGKILGRPHNSIRGRLMTLARLEQRHEEQQEEAQ